MVKHWTEKMFVDQASFYGATLESLVERAKAEVAGLVRRRDATENLKNLRFTSP